MERKIIHLNIADFSVAVERLLDSSLRKQPVIIALPSSRSRVFDMSDEAYQDGVRKGMPLNLARKRSRRAQVLPPRPAQYEKALHKCLVHAKHFTPLAERSSGNGHIYLDVTGTDRLFGPAQDIGWRLRKTLQQDLCLTPIWSVAPNKLVAKVASRLVKPIGEYIVEDGDERTFLAPLPLSLLPGIPDKTLTRLREMNIYRVHQATNLSVQELDIICGQDARTLYQVSRGIDTDPVSAVAQTNSLTCTHLFEPDTNEQEKIMAGLEALTSRTGFLLREREVGCRRLRIELTYTDGIQASRQAVSKEVLLDNHTLFTQASALLYRSWKRRVRVQQLHFVATLFCKPAWQLPLFGSNNVKRGKRQQVSTAMDAIQKRYGAQALQPGLQLSSNRTVTSQ